MLYGRLIARWRYGRLCHRCGKEPCFYSTRGPTGSLLVATMMTTTSSTTTTIVKTANSDDYNYIITGICFLTCSGSSCCFGRCCCSCWCCLELLAGHTNITFHRVALGCLPHSVVSHVDVYTFLVAARWFASMELIILHIDTCNHSSTVLCQ